MRAAARALYALPHGVPGRRPVARTAGRARAAAAQARLRSALAPTLTPAPASASSPAAGARHLLDAVLSAVPAARHAALFATLAVHARNLGDRAGQHQFHRR
ncbi:hypothetical protein STRTUCAR8_05808 [Streptomyces turgidiscabies Car8]|uniref:Uncharacterized protein n=1 Tax=Streptomyces turgidiscabies (strain Car8) TaxID=698760 RepID=L7FCR9_STRT8|nr:hypothetical protein STRTUCAR8_05808 [Streptomyces turgidiscabies Car8]